MSIARTSGHGKGRAVLRSVADEAVFSELSYRYPLKLLSPRTNPAPNCVPIAIAYILSYGGGLVSGDQIELDVDVGSNSALMLLTQGSTKVFKIRTGVVQSALGVKSSQLSSTITSQRMKVSIDSFASVLLLPDPVTCFASASYSQTQTFHLSSVTSSAIILDWFTSGRMARGEEWEFERYRSINEIWLGSRRIARDVMLLEQHAPSFSPSSEQSPSTSKRGALLPRSLRERLAPYACYATLFLVGPLSSSIMAALSTEYDRISQMQVAEPEPLLWSMSPLTMPSSTDDTEGSRDATGNGAIVRVMGLETEMVRNWLKQALKPLIASIGRDIFRAAFV